MPNAPIGCDDDFELERRVQMARYLAVAQFREAVKGADCGAIAIAGITLIEAISETVSELLAESMKK
jgi:hypothetical protein